MSSKKKDPQKNGAQSGKKEIPNAMKFVIGGAAGMTMTLFVQPLDLIKTRMQVSGMGTTKKEYKNTWHLIKHVMASEGPLAFYNGLSAGLLRQATYSSTRLGMYTWLSNKLSSPDGAPPGFAMKTSLGMIAGIGGALVGNPAEVALIRLMTDGKLPPAERRNYSNVFHALYRICIDEGVLALWRGVGPTLGRSIIVNAVQLSTYSQSKELLLKTGHFQEGIPLHFCSSMISGFFTTVFSLPVDIVKTRVQNMKTIDGKPEFSGSMDVITKIIQKEGVFAFWKGFTPYLGRIGPATVLIFIFLEQYTAAYKKYFL